MQEVRVQPLGRDDPLEEGTATHSSILSWRIPWTEEPGGLQSMGSQRVGHNCAKNFHFQFSSVTQSCLTLCDYMNCSTLGLPVHHQLPELTQTHLHRVGDAISSSVSPFSSHLQSFPASGSFLVSQFFASGGQSIGVSASASVLPMNIQD